MTFDVGLKILGKIKAALAEFNESEMTYGEDPLKTRKTDNEYTDGLSQAIWNVADHLSKGMETGDLVAFITAQIVTWGVQSGKHKIGWGEKPGAGTIFPSLGYLHRDMKIKEPKLIKYKWVPEIINDKTYQVGLAFRTCLEELIENEPDIRPLLEITDPISRELAVPFQQMILSLDERLNAYELVHPDVAKLPLIFQPDDDAPDHKSEQTDLFDDSKEKDEEKQEQQDAELEDAYARIITAQEAIDAQAPDIDLDDKLLKALLVDAENRKLYLSNAAFEKLVLTHEYITADRLEGQDIFIGLLECGQVDGNFYRANMQAMIKRLDEKNGTSTVESAAWLLGTVATLGVKELFNEVCAKRDWIIKKHELLEAIVEKLEQIKIELAIDIKKPANKPPDTTHLPVDNLYTLQQRYQAECTRLNAAKRSNLKKKLDVFELDLATIIHDALPLQFQLLDLEEMQEKYTREIRDCESIDNKLRLLAENIGELEKFINGEEAAHEPQVDCDDITQSIIELLKDIRSYTSEVMPTPLSNREERLQNETLALKESINKATQQIENHQANIRIFKETFDRTEGEKLDDIEENSRLTTTPQGTPEEQLATIQEQLAVLKKNSKFVEHMAGRKNSMIQKTREAIKLNKGVLKKKKTELQLVIADKDRTQLITQFFGQNLEDDLQKEPVDEANEGAFTTYLKKRKLKYATRDWYSLAFATVLGIFGYTSECTEREKYILRLNKCAKEYLANPKDGGYEPLKDLLKEGQRPGLLRPLFFSSRAAEGNEMYHKDSLQHQLKQFSDKIKAIEKPVKKKIEIEEYDEPAYLA